MHETTTIGTCSLCGGPVQVPSVWMGVVPPTPACASCGAVAAQHGPVIPMHRPPHQRVVPETTVVPLVERVFVGDFDVGEPASNERWVRSADTVARPAGRTFAVGDASVRVPDDTPWVEVTYTEPGPQLY